MSKYAVVTTFHNDGYQRYAKKMITTFLANWPQTVTLLAYPEDCTVVEQAANLIVRDLHDSSPELVRFKQRWSNDPRARGQVAQGPPDKKGKQPGIGFRWDAIRFSHKVYAVCHAARNTDADVLLWMDADMVCHTRIPESFIAEQTRCGLGFLGRPKKFTECGLYSMNLRDQSTQEFLTEFQRAYDTGRLFSMKEWNDCWVFDEVRKEVKQRHPGWQWRDWSPTQIQAEGHPLVNSVWGAYLDHLKGNRKDNGRSNRKDLLVNRPESYWTNAT